jgi:hypothetical protein
VTPQQFKAALQMVVGPGDPRTSLENFVSVLAGAQDNLQEKVRQRHMQISTRMCIQMHLTVHKNICI